MPRAGKIIAHHRHGQGKISAHALTPLREGPVGERMPARVADMYVDPSPYVSLAGISVERTRAPRANTMLVHDESHIQNRTRGKRTSRPPDNRKITVE